MVPPRGPVLLRHRVDRPQGAPTLVLGGSLGSTLEMWSLQMPALSETLRVVRYDHRGPGGTLAPPGPYTIGDLGGDVLAVLDSRARGQSAAARPLCPRGRTDAA